MEHRGSLAQKVMVFVGLSAVPEWLSLGFMLFCFSKLECYYYVMFISI